MMKGERSKDETRARTAGLWLLLIISLSSTLISTHQIPIRSSGAPARRPSAPAAFHAARPAGRRRRCPAPCLCHDLMLSRLDPRRCCRARRRGCPPRHRCPRRAHRRHRLPLLVWHELLCVPLPIPTPALSRCFAATTAEYWFARLRAHWCGVRWLVKKEREERSGLWLSGSALVTVVVDVAPLMGWK